MALTSIPGSGQPCQYGRQLTTVNAYQLYTQLIGEINRDRWSLDEDNGDFYTTGHSRSLASKLVPESISLPKALPIQFISFAADGQVLDWRQLDAVLTKRKEVLEIKKQQSGPSFFEMYGQDFINSAGLRAYDINTWRLVRMRLRTIQFGRKTDDQYIFDVTIVGPSTKGGTSSEFTFPLHGNDEITLCLEPKISSIPTPCTEAYIANFIILVVKPQVDGKTWKQTTRKSGQFTIYDYTPVKPENAIQINSIKDEDVNFQPLFTETKAFITQISRIMTGAPDTSSYDDIWKIKVGYSKTDTPPGANAKWYQNIGSSFNGITFYGTNNTLISKCSGPITTGGAASGSDLPRPAPPPRAAGGAAGPTAEGKRGAPPPARAPTAGAASAPTVDVAIDRRNRRIVGTDARFLEEFSKDLPV